MYMVGIAGLDKIFSRQPCPRTLTFCERGGVRYLCLSAVFMLITVLAAKEWSFSIVDGRLYY